MKTSYPYLVISRKYNIDYSIILMAAEYLLKKNTANRLMQYNRYVILSRFIIEDIKLVTIQHNLMVEGKVDWNSGYEVVTESP